MADLAEVSLVQEALFGAGGQAWNQIEAVLAVRPIEELRIYTPSGDSARALAAKVVRRHPGVHVWAAARPDQAVPGRKAGMHRLAPWGVETAARGGPPPGPG